MPLVQVRSYLSACNVLEVVPVYMGPAVVIGMHQLMRKGVVHVALGVDVVLTQHHLWQGPGQVTRTSIRLHN